MKVKFLTQQIMIAWPEFHRSQVDANAHTLLSKIKDLESSYSSVFLVNWRLIFNEKSKFNTSKHSG